MGHANRFEEAALGTGSFVSAVMRCKEGQLSLGQMQATRFLGLERRFLTASSEGECK